MSPTSQLTPTGLDIRQYLERKREEVDRYLQSVIPSAETMPTTLHESMRYSLFAGGKRVRPILAIAAAEAVGDAGKAVLPVASSLELIHTYSLIHDDLPAMDNDDFRRGKADEPQGLRRSDGDSGRRRAAHHGLRTLHPRECRVTASMPGGRSG